MINDFKTIFQGALGALTFGIYHQYVTQSTINTNNNDMRIDMKKQLEMIDQDHKRIIEILKSDIERLRKKMKESEERTQ